jgi:tripartite-type tricarboxylate transporter receptor subunit TctC
MRWNAERPGKEDMMDRTIRFLWSVIGLALLVTLLTPAPATPNSFFEGKTARILVGFSAGGGYDMYARLFARHMPKYIPGRPQFIVQNMPGGGGLRSANYLYSVAKSDGLTMAHLTREAVIAQFTRQPGVQYDTTKLIPLGSAAFENRVVFLHTGLAPYRTLEELGEAIAAGKKVFIGVTGVGSSGYTLWKTVEALAPKVKANLVLGYPGSAEVHLAIRKGEVMGYGQSKSSFLVQAKDLLNAGKVAVLAQVGMPDRTRDPDFANAPTFWELAKTKKLKSLVSVAAAVSIAGRPFFLPPGVAAGRARILRQAFMKAAEDPKLLAEAKKVKRPISAVSAKVIEELYHDVFAMSAEDRKEITKLFTGK